MNHNALVNLIGFSIREPLTLVLELMPLGDLNTYLKTHPNVPLELKVRLVDDIAAGMCYMHALTPKIVHCDLKTPNILV
jgi:serine/threonine protein kinase